MNATNARARYGMTAKVKPSSVNLSGTQTIGEADSDLTLSCTKPYSLRAIIIDPATLAFDLLDPAAGFTADSWVGGTAQVETATAAGTITVSGNATVTVTAAGMTGSPKAISVAVTSGDTAATWAGKVRTALAADADVSARFTVGGTTTSIVLTRKPTHTFTVPDGNGGTTSLYLYDSNDGTLNIALADDTSSGITEAATSANTTAGVISSGVKLYDADGKDFEGISIPAITGIAGMIFKLTTGAVGYVGNNGLTDVEVGELTSLGDTTIREFITSATSPEVFRGNEITFTASDGPSDLTITVFGKA